MMGLGEGGRKRAGAMLYLVGLPSYKNVGDAVEAFLIRRHVHIPEDPLSPSSKRCDPPPTQPAAIAEPRPSHRAELAQERLRNRQEICQQAKDLHAQGWSIHAIAKHLGRERTTIRKYLQVEGEWLRTPRPPRPSLLDPYRASILEQWERGCH